MAANNGESYIDYLNKFVDKYNNTYHRSINNIHVGVNHSALNKGIESNKLSLKLVIEP